MPTTLIRSGGYLDSTFPKFTSGNYYFCFSQAGTATSNGLGNNSLRVAPWFVPTPVTIVRIGAEFTAAGDAASVLRLGIYAMSLTPGSGLSDPTAVILDAGTISTGTGDAGTVATGGTPGIYDITVNTALARGWYWVGGVVQGAPGTQPTIRICSGANLFEDVRLGSGAPAANSGFVGCTFSPISGALSANPTYSPAGNAPPRVHVKVA